MRDARAFLRAPLLRCRAPVFTALSIRESSARYSLSAPAGIVPADRVLEPAEPGLHL